MGARVKSVWISPHVERRGNSVRVNMPVPKNVQHIIGKKHLQHALGVIPNDKTAIQLARNHLTTFEKRIELARKALAGTPDLDSVALNERIGTGPHDGVFDVLTAAVHEDRIEKAHGGVAAKRYRGIVRGEVLPLSLYRDDWLASLKRDKTRQEWLLRAEHVEVIGGITCLRIPKVKKEKRDRLIPIPDAILPAVTRLVELAPTRGGFLCAAPASAKGKSRGSEPGRRFMRWLNAKGFGDDVDWHSFRRTCAWLLETAGLPENIAARVIGHAMGITFTLYSGESDMGWMKPEMDKAYGRLPPAVYVAFGSR